MGQGLTFGPGEGPQLTPALHDGDFSPLEPNPLHFAKIYETVAKVRKAIDPSVTMLGFAGSPWFNYPTSQGEVLSDRHARHNGGSTVVWTDGHASWKHKRATGNIDVTRQTLPNWWTWFGLPVDPLSDDRLL
jgi:prepilin-type processing-associated H-X9-DG protein